jgi:hypothetical protein
MVQIGQRVRHPRFGTGALHQTNMQPNNPTGLVE